MEKVINTLAKILSVFIAGILILLVIFACIFTAQIDSTVRCVSEMIVFCRCNILSVLILLLLFFVIIFLFLKFIKNVDVKKFLIVALIFMICICIAWTFFAKIEPRADMKSITDTAIKLHNGDVSEFEKGGYFDVYPFQIGYLLVVEILYHICRSYIFLQVVNGIAAVGSMFILYKITERLFKNQSISKILIILECGCVYLFIYSTMIYGNILGLMFALLSILFLLKYYEENKILDVVFMGMSIVSAVIIKSNYLIFLVAELLIMLLDILARKKVKNIILILGVCLLFVSSNFILKSFYEFRTGIKISDGLPKVAWINMGISENNESRSFGWYDSKLSMGMAHKYNYNYEKVKEEGNIYLRERGKYLVKNPKYLLYSMSKKVLTQWVEPTYGSLWINTPISYDDINDGKLINNVKISLYSYGGRLNNIFVEYCKIYQLLLYMMVIVYVITSIKNTNYVNAVLFIIFIGGFIFHIFWEGKSMYVFQYTLILLPYAAFGIEKVYNWIRNILIIKFSEKNSTN